MLSCRHSGPGTVHYKRRLDSADCIVEIMAHGGHKTLPPLPLVPYALAFATTVIYRALRDKQRPIESAFSDLSLCCRALDVLGRRWTSVQGVAKLANRLLGSSSPDKPSGSSAGVSQQEQSEASVGDGTLMLPMELSTQTAQPTAPSLSTQDAIIGPPISLPGGQASSGEPALGGFRGFDGQLVEHWPNLDASPYQLDVAIDDLFDHGISDVFRDPGTWELLHMGDT